MDHKQGTDRNQMFMFCLESAIASHSFVRVAKTGPIDHPSPVFKTYHTDFD